MSLTKAEQKKADTYFESLYIMPPECDPLCRFRECYNKGVDKGRFTPGRGYDSYHTQFKPACMTRLCHGCPDTKITPEIIKKAIKWSVEQISLSQDKTIKNKERIKAINNAKHVLRFIDLHWNETNVAG